VATHVEKIQTGSGLSNTKKEGMKRIEERGDGGSNIHDMIIYFGNRKREFMKNRGPRQEEQETFNSKDIEIADRELTRETGALCQVEPMTTGRMLSLRFRAQRICLQQPPTNALRKNRL